jgi:hypothetical protein
MIGFFRTRSSQLMATALLALISLQSADAQNLTGQISGRVDDPSGSVIVGAPVELVNELNKQARQTQTDSTGGFLFVELLPGSYSLRIQQPGFRPIFQTKVEVTAAERVALPPIHLEVGDVSSTVTVQSESARVQTESSERAGLISAGQVENTPLRGRDYVGLLKLLPGVTDLVTRDAPGGTMATVNGGLAGQVLITIDGIVSQDSGSTTGTQYQPSVDAIGEMKVLLTNYQAEYGARSGGVVNVVIKNGTRDFHGSGYYYKRNEAFNANNFFNNANRVNLDADGKAKRPVYRYDNPGYTVGGPVIIPGTSFNKDRNKLFFFWSQDILIRKNPTALMSVTFPTALERQGNFSQSVYGNNGQPVIVKDPINQQPFAGNVIPTSRIDPAGVALLNLLPLPNATDTTGNRQFNSLYQFVLDQPRQDKILRIDYNIASNTLFFARLLNGYQNTSGYGAGGLGAASNWPQLKTDYSIRTAGAVGTVIHTFSPNLVNEFSWGINRAYQQVSASDQAGLTQNTRAGTGLGPKVLAELYPQANPLNLLPTTTYGAGTGGGIINNSGGLSFETRFPYFGTDTIQNITENLSWVKGRHNLKFGIYFEHESRNSPDNSTFNGNLNFGSTTLNPLDTGYGYSNAVLGVIQSYTESSLKPIRHSRYSGIEWYAQDNWKVSRRLSFDLGLRFQWTPPSYSNGVQMAAFDPTLYNASLNPPLIQPVCLTSARPCSAATGSNPPMGLNPVTGQLVPAVLVGAFTPNAGTPFQAMRIYNHNILNNPAVGLGPRLGFAYDVFGDSKTAIRGGIGAFYDRGGGTGTTSASNSCCIYITDPPLQKTPVTYYTTLPQLLTAPGYLTPQAVDSTQRDYKLPASYNYSLGVQRNLGRGFLFEVAYVGNTTRHRYNVVLTNQIPYGTTRTASGALNPAAIDPSTGQPFQANFLRPVLGYGNISYGQFNNSSNYNSMQTQLNRRFGTRFQFGSTWTWSKVMSYVPAPYVSNSFTYSPDANDRRHNVTINWTYKVPDGSALWKNAVTKQAFDGWQLTGIATFLSGSPATVGYSVTGAPAGYTVTGSPDGLVTRIQIVGDPILTDSARSGETTSKLNPAAFALPAQSAFGIGNSARTFFYGPGVENFDLSLFKEFRLGSESRVFQLRAELYNALNHVNFNNPNTSAVFNYATGAQTNTNFGKYTAAGDPRYIVLSARFRF